MADGPAELRPLGDSPRLRQAIFHHVLHAAQNLPPLENQRHVLHLRDPAYEGPDRISIAQRKQAILGGQTLSRRLVGTWELQDKSTGQVVDRKRQTIARVPYLSDSGTFVHRGTEYTLGSQLRLKPGIYTRQKENGEIESHVNILPGDGPSHRYFYDPEKGSFYLRLHQAKLPLLPILKSLGATDRQLEDAWGSDVYFSNRQQDDPAAFNKVYAKFIRPHQQLPLGDLEGRREQLRELFNKMRLDPYVMEHTLGHPYDHASLDAILAATKKLLGVARGKADVDDRDHLAYQQIMGPEDLMAERLAKDAGGVRRKLLFQASLRGDLSPVRPNALGSQLEAALLHSGLGQALEELNPAELLDKQTKISKMGEGGLSSIDSVPDSSRSVQPSHLNFIDAIRTPESLRAGIDLNLAGQVHKGPDGKIYAPFQDLKTGQTVFKTPQEVADLAVRFPGEERSPYARVAVMHKGHIRYVKPNQAQLALGHFQHAFSHLNHLVPMKSGIKGQRSSMASRMLTQALPLAEPEAPWVQSAMPWQPDRSYEEEYGRHMGAVHARQGGVVEDVQPGQVVVKTPDGKRETYELHDNTPFNRKTFLHNTPSVQPGQRIAPGQLLARSNFTDAQGTTALGANFRVGYLPFHGAANFEDAIAISESAAKKLVSEHMYQHGVEFDSRHRRGKTAYIGLFPGTYNRRQLDTLDADGVVQPGTEIDYGHPLILAPRERDRSLNRLHRKRQPGYEDRSVTWEHSFPGVVTDVVKQPNQVAVVVKARAPMQVGDKLSGRFGDKGVTSQIIPDAQMPRDAEGRPLEILVNPLGIVSRTNPAQIVEAVLGKISARTGQPYKVRDFEDIEDLVDFAHRELTKHGLSDLEDVTDPRTGRKIPGVLVGNRFLMKLSHTAESKSQGRGLGAYTAAGEPARGGESGSKKIGILELNALLSHAATGVIRDAAAIRGQRNEEFWLPFMQGYRPPSPKVPLVYQKFLHELQAAGINVQPQGGQLHVMALTDKDVDRLAGNRKLTTGETVRWDKGLAPIPGGLFDPSLTGGHNGSRWAKLDLAEPFPSPVMEDPIRRVLGLTKEQFLETIAGRHTLDGETGPAALQRALSRINLPQAVEQARADIASGRKTRRDDAVRKLGYLKAAQRLGLHPKDWMLSKVPVLPPIFRPVSVMTGNEQPLVADANYLYRELFEANRNLHEMKQQSSEVGPERLAVYHAFKAVTGLGDPLQPQLQEKNVRGVLKHILGSSPKGSVMQRRLLSSAVDLVGRAVITPDSGLDMDHVGLPEKRAWDIYRNFIVRRLRRRGMPLVQALHEIENRTPRAREELLAEMSHRPVIVNRAPVLHRFGVMAFWPSLTAGDTLKVSPLFVKPMGADFDGDAVQYHVPVEEEARQEAIERMLPSRNLLSPADFKSPNYAPMNEFLAGLWRASQPPRADRRPRVFANAQAARDAYKRGDLDLDEPVDVPVVTK